MPTRQVLPATASIGLQGSPAPAQQDYGECGKRAQVKYEANSDKGSAKRRKLARKREILPKAQKNEQHCKQDGPIILQARRINLALG